MLSTNLGILNVLGSLDPFYLITQFLNGIRQRSHVASNVIQEMYCRHTSTCSLCGQFKNASVYGDAGSKKIDESFSSKCAPGGLLVPRGLAAAVSSVFQV